VKSARRDEAVKCSGQRGVYVTFKRTSTLDQLFQDRELKIELENCGAGERKVSSFAKFAAVALRQICF